jgi:outer membrane lipoprotein-sorting protein
VGSPKLVGLIWGIAMSFLLVSLAQAAEFSAVVINKDAQQEMQRKIYVKGEKVRMESSTPTGSTVSILRLDKKAIWFLMPGHKTYMEMPSYQKAFAKALNIPEGEVSKKLVGTETLNGYETEKYETTVKIGNNTQKRVMWISKKLGVPLRIESADKSFILDYKDIKEGGVDDALFEIPADYQKMTMPEMKWFHPSPSRE